MKPSNATKRTNSHAIVSPEEWLEARKVLLAREKELTRAHDEVARLRRELPWTKVTKSYRFDGLEGEEALGDLFAGRSQLIIQHFMLGPGWIEGCVGCSFTADHVEGALYHQPHHDVSLVVVARAPLAEIQAYQRRMGWRFKWVSSFRSDFNFDFQVSFRDEDRARGKVFHNYKEQDYLADELAGHSVFYRDPASGEIFHTYSTYNRGDEQMIGTYHSLDIAPKGRNETGPNSDLTDWVRHHDRYVETGNAAP